MREIPLTRGMVARVDDEDYEAVMAAGPWQADQPSPGRFYARRTRRVNTRRIVTPMQSFLLGAPRVDHINGDSLDNRRQNLRVVTHAQNGHNSRRPSHNTSGYKGVTWHKIRRKWLAFIKVNQEQLQLGYYDTRDEAAQAYDAAARLYFGEYARLNFPEED